MLIFSILFGLFLPLWCLSTPANYYFKVSFYSKAIFNAAKNDSKYRNVVTLKDNARVSDHVTKRNEGSRDQEKMASMKSEERKRSFCSNL